MPVPKRRHSKARGRKRRTHWKLNPPQWVECPHCHNPKLPHRVCMHCGYYGEKKVILVESKKK